MASELRGLAIRSATNREDTMLARLGNVLYWAGCIVAGLIVIYAGVIYSTEGYARSEGAGLLVVFALMAFAVWPIGYVLAGT
jgi:hypothetical protein